MSDIISKRMASRQRRIQRRLDRFQFPDDMSRPMMRGTNRHYELASRASGTAYGGMGLIHQLLERLELPREINRRVSVFKIHLPYFESDHVLNLLYNALCEGRCLEDLELRRQDEAYLNSLGAERIPDPTTAGDFCRRFRLPHIEALHDAFDAGRKKVWASQPQEFFEEACLDADGILVPTNGECKEGMDISSKGVWGYHALVVTLRNTGEVLRLVNRPGNRPSHEGAAGRLDEAKEVCRAAGFRRIRLCGDTDFSQTKHLDRWHDEGVLFTFGLDVCPSRFVDADDLPKSAWKPLIRPPRYVPRGKLRGQRERVKQKVVEERGFKDIQQVDEWVAEMDYRPVACRRAYRLVIVRKNQMVSEPKQGRLFADYRYFIYITNDRESTPSEVVFFANDRCNQENVLAQLREVRALRAPLNTLLSNWVYMLITAQAWNVKAWLALSLPPPQGRWREKHAMEQERLLRMEFRTFANTFLRIPCQIVKTGRKIVHRLLAWNVWQPVFFRLVAQIARPLRC
ncbi:MAG TPA: IS1380 family transposase [Hyphomicrobiaceae bacterium]|nr:IS1380 family transposase [Hyphomicrobiaceae bacterium]